MPDFEATPHSECSVGAVLRINGPESEKYLRITHTFDTCVYAMWVGEPKDARYGRRPRKFALSELNKMAQQPQAVWGKLILPPALSSPPEPGTDRDQQLGVAWEIVAPLIDAFNTERNLARDRFTTLIARRAEDVEASFITVSRLLLRYYYFGCTRYALLSLPSGLSPREVDESGHVSPESERESSLKKRRGRQSVLSEELGENDFVVSEDDKTDMVECLKKRLRRGPTNIPAAHEEYLATFFKQRHPEIHAEYIKKQRQEPVTKRQFAYYVNQNGKLEEELAKNLRRNKRNSGRLGSVYASGPGEVYEIDSTGGRIFLVTSSGSSVYKPTIYLIIDRWSRYVVAVYLSLRPPSYEEVRYALLIAFTSREARFHPLGVNVDDRRWPVGCMPAVICPDRGAEFISDSMENSVVNDLRIELTVLPPLCPDGKAIVERFIRELKRRMHASNLKGTYADRPLDPETKKALKKAKNAAVHDLATAYRTVIEIVVDHNNRPHSELRKRRQLSQAGIQPTPKNAYLWGLENISGVRSPPFSESDYYRMLLCTDHASISNGQLRYKGRIYEPANESAHHILRTATTRAKQVTIRIDKTFPHFAFVVDKRGEWAKFEMNRSGASALGTLTIDEEELVDDQGARLWARADYDARVARVADRASGKASPASSKRSTTTTVDSVPNARDAETAEMKHALLAGMAGVTRARQDPIESEVEADWRRLEEEEQRRHLEYVRQRQNDK